MIGLCTLSSGGNAGLPSDQGSTARSAVSIYGWENPDKGQMVDQVRRALTTAGVESSRYSGHSFRSGAATMAAQRGFSDATTKTLGRWQS